LGLHISKSQRKYESTPQKRTVVLTLLPRDAKYPKTKYTNIVM